MSENSITIIPNNRNDLYVAQPRYDGEEIIDVWLDPIVAWSVYLFDDDDGLSYSTLALAADQNDVMTKVIYDIKTGVWFEPEGATGKGKEELINYLKSSGRRG